MLLAEIYENKCPQSRLLGWAWVFKNAQIYFSLDHMHESVLVVILQIPDEMTKTFFSFCEAFQFSYFGFA